MGENMITWKITQMEYNTTDGGVIIVHWECVAEETVGEKTFRELAYGSFDLTPEPSSPDFIPYENLTEENVLSWVYQYAGIDKTDIESKLETSIDQQKNISTLTGLPWQ